MPYVITCGDEGVQINEGTKLGLLGAGLGIDNVGQVISAWKKLLGDDLRIAASAENDWVKAHFKLDTFEQADATFQQKAEAFADAEKLLYSGFIPFSDPRNLQHDIKGHMVRPKGMHFANKVCFTLAGGEQTFNLSMFVVSAEWIGEVEETVAREIIRKQVEYYAQLVKQDQLEVVFETTGALDAEIVASNQKLLEKWGYKPTN